MMKPQKHRFERQHSRIIRPILVFILISHCPEELFAQNITSSNSSSTEIPTIPNATPIIDLASTGLPCNNNSLLSCQISEGFVCRDEICKCAYPNLTYNLEMKKCFAKVGQQCGFFIGLKNASSVSCPENAICGLINLDVVTDGQNNQYSVHQCACIYTHYPNEKGECVPLAMHSESCDEQRKCTPDSSLICMEGTCQCQFKEDQFFDTETNKCVSYAGGNCTRNCVPNSICDFWGSGTCQCRLDHQISASRHCDPIPPGYLLPCLGEKELCNSEIGLKCIDKVCQCKNPLHQVYDYQQEKCIGLAGDICDPDDTNNCIKNSKCSKKDSKHVCTCSKRFSTTPYRKCMKSHGENCSNEFCNIYRGLACVNGSCQCYDSFLKYDATLQACTSSLGSQCGKIFVPFPGDWIKSSCPECDSYYFACESNLVCSRDLGGTEIGALEKFRCQVKQ